MKLCLEGCGQFADPKSANGSRCTACERARNRTRNADPKRAAYKDPAYRAVPVAGAQCACCGSRSDLTRDHVTPLARTGSGEPSRVIVVLCRRCNASKGDGDRCRLHDRKEGE